MEKPTEYLPTTRECLHCGHAWIPRVAMPRRCPQCNSPRWNKPPRAGVEAAGGPCGAQDSPQTPGAGPGKGEAQ